MSQFQVTKLQVNIIYKLGHYISNIPIGFRRGILTTIRAINALLYCRHLGSSLVVYCRILHIFRICF